MTSKEVKQWSKDQVKPPSIVESLTIGADEEGWKYLQSFVGVKFNDAEKRRLWPHVKNEFQDLFGKRRKQRPNLSTLIKKALWAYLEGKILQ